MAPVQQHRALHPQLFAGAVLHRRNTSYSAYLSSQVRDIPQSDAPTTTTVFPRPELGFTTAVSNIPRDGRKQAEYCNPLCVSRTRKAPTASQLALELLEI